jgi:hypothetical protein
MESLIVVFGPQPFDPERNSESNGFLPEGQSP